MAIPQSRVHFEELSGLLLELKKGRVKAWPNGMQVDARPCKFDLRALTCIDLQEGGQTGNASQCKLIQVFGDDSENSQNIGSSRTNK